MSFRSTGTAPAFTKKMRTPPPDETGMEATYLAQLREKQTPVAVKLLDGEVLRGWIEFDYDGAGPVRLEAGSSVVQPPGIRHAELAHSADLEMLEFTLPAAFSTLADQGAS